MATIDAASVLQKLRAGAEPARAAHYPKFFKSGPGEYGAGDRFMGVTTPTCRRIAKAAAGIADSELTSLLHSAFHEARAVALFILVNRFQRSRLDAERETVYRLYVANLERVNNWDLVDTSAPTIVGGYLEQRDRAPLYAWARSASLWERRIAILATFRFIRNGDFTDTLAIAGMVLADEEDLIHKAVGWMLREVGNRDRAAEETFLAEHYRTMPRTMLRYAIEKFPEPLRQAYLRGTV